MTYILAMQSPTINPTPISTLQSPAYAASPSVSVLLPIYNEAKYIERCLDAILAQDYPLDELEILVIDGRSTDNTRDLVRDIQQQRDNLVPRIHLLDNPNQLQAYGLNIGVGAAKGDVLVRVDGHTLIESDYVRQCIETLRVMAPENVVNVGGRMIPIGETDAGWAIATATRSPFSVPTAFHHSQQPQFVDTVYLGAWPRQVFELVGDFNPAVNINEDYELNYRIRQQNGKIYLNPAIRSVYFCRSSFRALARQYYRYGVQKVQMLKLHPEAIRARQLVPPLFVMGLVCGPLLGLLHPSLMLLWIIGMAAYLLLALAAAARARRAVMESQVNPVIRPTVPPPMTYIFAAFVTIHMTWGAGFWAGWLKGTKPHHTGSNNQSH
jgi:succinoglycan biosynthesis protein ExoA